MDRTDADVAVSRSSSGRQGGTESVFSITRGGFPRLCVQREIFGTGVCVVLTSLRITDKHFNLKANVVCLPVNSCSLVVVVVVGRGGRGSKHD